MDVFGVKKDTATSVDSSMRSYVHQQHEAFQKKNHAEFDLLTRIRNYSLKRSTIEHEYGQALQSLRQQFSIDERQYKDLGFSNRSVYGIWNAYLEEIKRLSSQHVSLGQFYAQNIGNNLRNVQASKMETVKKCTEEMKKCTQELIASSTYTEKYRKSYTEAFTNFTSTSLKSKSKNFIKNERKEPEKTKLKLTELEKSANDARNLYLVRLEATRTHRNWFAQNVLPKLIHETEGHVYESLWTYLSAATCIEVETYESAGRDFKTLSNDMEKMPSADEHRQAFLSTCEISPSHSLEFEPCPSDNIFDIRRTCVNDPTLTAEAKTWVSSYIRAQKIIEETSYKIAQLEKMARYADDLGKKNSGHGRQNGVAEVTKTIDEQKDAIRRAEINKLKAEAILHKLRAAGVNIDELMRATGTDSLSSYSSYGSQRSSSHMSLASVSEPTSDDSTPTGDQTRCAALYSYEPKNDDELQIAAGEILILLDPLENNPWPRAKNTRGQIGLVPCNYIERVQTSTTVATKILRPPLPPKPEKIIFTQPIKSPSSISHDQCTSAHLLFYCRAKYGYVAKDAEELNFNAGDILGVVDETPHDVLDGWWKGGVIQHGTIKEPIGTFPSMLVEKISTDEVEKSQSAQMVSKSVVVLRNNSTRITSVSRRSLKTWYGSEPSDPEPASGTNTGGTILDQWRPPSRLWKSRLQLNGDEPI